MGQEVRSLMTIYLFSLRLRGAESVAVHGHSVLRAEPGPVDNGFGRVNAVADAPAI